jgi:acyl-CoA reductase-like NAD-dependent aldehyde dehydrogenase
MTRSTSSKAAAKAAEAIDALFSAMATERNGKPPTDDVGEVSAALDAVYEIIRRAEFIADALDRRLWKAEARRMTNAGTPTSPSPAASPAMT